MPGKHLFGAIIVAAFSLSPTAQGQGSVTGEVVKVDGPKGTITLKHGPIVDLGLTARSAVDAFRVNGDVMQGMAFNALRPGDHIKFCAERINGEFTITDVEKK